VARESEARRAAWTGRQHRWCDAANCGRQPEAIWVLEPIGCIELRPRGKS
jgi:hypothetical protein